MDDDLDSTLVANFYAPTSSNRTTGKARDKVTGNRRQRIKARKTLRHAKHIAEPKQISEVDSGLPADTVKDSTEDQTSDSADKQGKAQTKDGKHHGQDIISSLFRKNPKIPSLESSTVKQVTEKLFSSGHFKDAPLHPYMISNLEKLGFSQMTTVQQMTIPKLMAGHDTLVQSQTGSGKTLAYAIPIVENLQSFQPKLKRSDGPVAMVIVPTRELALQSFQTFQKLLKPFVWIVPGCIMGGEKLKAEKARLRKGVNILVATPGRLLDHLDNTSSLNMNRIKWVILDEADRLLDLGYEKAVSKIISAVEQQKTVGIQQQTVLLSATLSEGVERLAGVSLHNPARVSASKDNREKAAQPATTSDGVEQIPKTSNRQEETFAIPENLTQQFVITPCKLRLVTLMIYVISKCSVVSQSNKMIVFLSTQDSVEFHYKLALYLTGSGSTFDSEEFKNTDTDNSPIFYRLHGNMIQQERTKVFEEFSRVSSGILFCTDVAARGLHLPAVKWVVQFTCPSAVSDYIHRVGRTARVGSKGQSLLFLMPDEVDYIKVLNEQKISVQECPMADILKSVMKVLPSLPDIEDSKREIPRTIEEGATYLQMCCEHLIRRNTDMATCAKKAFQSFIRAYATYPTSLKSIFHVKHLHLGHVAKTFALRDAPAGIGGTYSLPPLTQQQKRKQKNEDGPPMKKRRGQISEYTSTVSFSSTTKPAFKRKKKKQKPGKK